METYKRTPLQLFIQPQHFLIPLFQRAYVWKEDEQWEPLWKDIRRVAEFRLTGGASVQHFLGAVVLQGSEARISSLPVWNVIDGQQRITTLQILMDAVNAVITRPETVGFASQLEPLTHNAQAYVTDGTSLLKLRHLNNDRAAFDEVMDAEAPVDYDSLDHPDSQITQAHKYFSTVVAQWLGNPEDAEFVARAGALASVLQSDLQLVTIELSAAEDSQEIFETLNARGTPLTAADLVRNFVFQRIEAEGGDTAAVYRDGWPFESKFWSKEVSVGRYLVSRSSVFLNQWLTAQTGEDVRLQSTFIRFKSYVEHQPDLRVIDLLPAIKQQADAYEAWTIAASKPEGTLTRTEMAVYRMGAAGSQLLMPLLIWLNDPARHVPADVVDEVVTTAESWVQRRQLLRLPTSDLGRIVADLIGDLRNVEPARLAARTTEVLGALNVTSTYWPGDAEVRSALETDPVYRRFPRPRLRAILEAIEDEFRAQTRQPQVARAGFPIEHVLPQRWGTNWPVDSDEAELLRNEHVHRLGNLTLLTTKLNSNVSNLGWAEKRAKIMAGNTFTMTGRLVAMVEDTVWDEAAIDSRSAEMIDALLAVWPVPAGHEGKVVDPQAKTQEWIELKHLLAAGLMSAGDVISAVPADFAGATATLSADGNLHIDGRVFKTPTGAAKHLRNRTTNGWTFWALADGRRLKDVRAELIARRS